MNSHIGWTRISTCFAASAFLGSLPFVGAGAAAAANASSGMDGGMWVQVTGLPNGPKDNVTCYWKWDNSTANGWDSNGPATNGVMPIAHLTTEGHTYLDVQCNNNGTSVFTGSFYVSKAAQNQSPMPPPPAAAPPAPAPAQPPAAAPADPLGKSWSFSDSGGAPQPWTGTWTRRGTSDTWDWQESNAALPGQPTASGTATITFDGTTVRIHRLNASSPQTCDYTGTPTGSSITGLFTGFSGTVNCSNSGIANMPWSATIQ